MKNHVETEHADETNLQKVKLVSWEIELIQTRPAEEQYSQDNYHIPVLLIRELFQAEQRYFKALDTMKQYMEYVDNFRRK